MKIRAYAAHGPKQPLQPFEYELLPVGPGEVDIRVTHCGICHSDVAMIDNEWGFSRYPVVPGHEVIGTVQALGEGVTELRVGQRVGLGWQAGSCGRCEYCRVGKEIFCDKESATIVGRYGGFADYVRAQARFAIPMPEAIDAAVAGPLMCAGTTVFTPLMHFNVRPTQRAAVLGVGGLGHLAIQYLRAYGCHVTAISATRSKEAESRQLGAAGFIATGESGALARAAKSFDFVISTVPGEVNWGDVVGLLRPEGRLCIVGVPGATITVPVFPLIGGERSVSGGRTGAPSDIATMLGFTALHGIKPMINPFPMREVNAALDHLRSGKARYRVVLVA